MKKKILISVAVFVLFFVAGTILKAKAETKGATGWLWGGSEDASIPGTMGMVDGNETGVYDISMAHTSKDVNNIDYGVLVDENGNLDKYAWSDGLGWISFVDSDLNCSADTDIPDCSPARVNNGKVVGYARVLGIKDALAVGNSGGWKGYLQFVNANVDSSTGKFSDGAYMWNGEVAKDPIADAANPNSVKEGLGWISLKNATIPCVEKKVFNWVGDDPCSDENVCGSQTKTYKCSLTGQSCGHWASGYVDDKLCEDVGKSKPADETLNCGTCSNSGKWQETKPQQ
ncbi:MAG: hypothetical protein HGB08_03510 [Candidatus Moranbacteria bacterium]|nr:hypothetical protein [Candidatus Moranbacteria bacterium]